MVLLLDGNSEHVSTYEGKEYVLNDKISSMTAFDLNKCLKQIKKTPDVDTYFRITIIFKYF